MPLVDVKNLSSTQVAQLATKECNRIGYRLLNIRESEREGDKHIRVVIAHNEKEEQFAVWYFNIESCGLFQGGYHCYFFNTTTKEKAREDALNEYNSRK